MSSNDSRISKPANASGILAPKNEPHMKKLTPSSVYIDSQQYRKSVSLPGQPRHFKQTETQQLPLKHAHGTKTTTNVSPLLKVSGQSHQSQIGGRPITIKQVMPSAIGVHHRGDAVFSIHGGTVTQKIPSGALSGTGKSIFHVVGLAKDSKMPLLVPSASSSKTVSAPACSAPYLLQATASPSSVTASSSSHSTDHRMNKLRHSSIGNSLSYDYGSPFDSAPISLVTNSEHQRTSNSLSEGPMDISQNSKKSVSDDQPTDMSWRTSLKPNPKRQSPHRFHSGVRLQTCESSGETHGEHSRQKSSMSDWKEVSILIAVVIYLMDLGPIHIVRAH